MTNIQSKGEPKDTMFEKPLISFDYAIKYLLKNKADHEIVEGFISALLKSEGYGPVKIEALLETESNREYLYLKKSIADLVVSDAKGNKYIVEIERNYDKTFMNKACFNASRLIVDTIGDGVDYGSIKKVFHISLLYFKFGNMQKPLYHGKTILHEVDTKNPVDLHIRGRDGVVTDIMHALPEYFVISIPLFDNVIRQEIDEWLYVMKNEDTKADFTSPHIKKLEERLNIFKMDPNDRVDYYRYAKETASQNNVILSAEELGIEKGIAQGVELGIAKEREKMARQLHSLGVSLDVIQKATDLSTEALTELLEKPSTE